MHRFGGDYCLDWIGLSAHIVERGAVVERHCRVELRVSHKRLIRATSIIAFGVRGTINHTETLFNTFVEL